MKSAVYPGSFDPITNGHISIIRRGLEIFDEVIVAVARNSEKKSLFTIPERLDMISEALSDTKGVRVDTFQGLLVDYVIEQKTNAILRGLRALSDFDYEFQLALMNRKLSRKVQTIFLMTDYKWLYVSSTIVKEAASLGGDINGLVPPIARERLAEKFPLLKARLTAGKNGGAHTAGR
ncbi:MAG: pantetheine-phosphate adenylyltransferase [Desulfarculus sp.]|nr:pantetheine-phosphate adenylyltransferase [Desulfarculus sp.]